MEEIEHYPMLEIAAPIATPITKYIFQLSLLALNLILLDMFLVSEKSHI